MMRLASCLLVATLLTTSMISGTFAKYVANDTGADSARVAKFGVVVEADSFEMFTDKYETDDKDATFEGKYSVVSSGGTDDEVLAPGTSGSFADISIKGTPEVAVDVEIESNVAISDNWSVAGDFYCPVVVKVGGEEISGLNYESAKDFADAIKAKIDGKSARYAPNKDLSEEYDTTNLDLAWEWAFEGAAGSEQTDVKDTALGDKAVAEELTIEIGVKISVTQID